MEARGDVCVIYNPAAGRGRTLKAVERLRREHHGVEFRPTDRAGHGEEVAIAAVREGFRTVVAAGGDGTVHEVANGVLRAGDPDVVFSAWPVGSANDYAFVLGMCDWWNTDRTGKLVVRKADV